MAMSELHQRVHQALVALKLNGPKDLYLGICGNVVAIMGNDAVLDEAVDNLLCSLFEDWPDKSACEAYPVGNWVQNQSKLFWHYHDHFRSMWNKKDRYGQARWALLDHCINKLA